jgi:tetratricopeptide (TPR) repeat protein
LAIDVLDRYLQIDDITSDQRFLALCDLGHCHNRLGDHRKSLAAYEAAARLVPRNPLARQCVGHEYFNLGDYKKARRAYEYAMKLDPDYSKYADDIADACFNLDYRSDFRTWALRAIHAEAVSEENVFRYLDLLPETFDQTPHALRTINDLLSSTELSFSEAGTRSLLIWKARSMPFSFALRPIAALKTRRGNSMISSRLSRSPPRLKTSWPPDLHEAIFMPGRAIIPPRSRISQPH